MIKEYVTSQHLTQIAETIQTYVDYKNKELESKIDYIEVSYEELVTLRKEARLQPGCFYCIYDYATTTSSPDTQSAGHNFPIVVLATSTHTLSEEAKAIQHWGDEYFNNSNLEAWKIWYCLDNDTDKFAWAGATKPVLLFNCYYDTDTQGSGMSVFKRDESLDIMESGITYYGYTFVTLGGPPVFNGGSILWYTEEFPEITDNNIPHTFYQFSDEKMVPINMDSRFYEGKESIGKGVIYRMIDEFGNDCPYDFKNIMFKRPNAEKDDNYYFTFSWVEEDGNIIDASISGNNGYLLDDVDEIPGVFSNVIGKYIDNGVNKLPVNIFISNYNYEGGWYYGCYNNTLGNGCYNNTFGNDCSANSFGEGCHDNEFGDECENNSFGNNCYNNTLGEGCANNEFGNGCNTNTFGINCNSNLFGDSCCDNNFEGIFLRNNYMPNNCNNIIISGQTDENNYIQNLVISKGVSNTQITIPDSLLNVDYEIKVAKNSAGEIKIYCEADLIS